MCQAWQGMACYKRSDRSAVGLAFGIDARRASAAVRPGGEVPGRQLRDPRLVGGEVGGGEAPAPLAGATTTEKGAHILPQSLRRVWRNLGRALAHPSQACLRRQLPRAIR